MAGRISLWVADCEHPSTQMKERRSERAAPATGAVGKLQFILPPPQKREALRLLASMVLVSIIESLGVGSILPFVAVAANPAVLNGAGPLAAFYKYVGSTDPNTFLLLLGAGVLTVLVVGNLLRGISTWQTHRFSQMCGHALAARLITSYLARPYEYFLTRHSADLGKNILHEVHQVVNGVLFPAISGVSRAITALLIIGLLLFADPVLTLAAIASIGGAYFAIYMVSRALQSRLGERHVTSNNSRYYVASEIFSGIKDVKLGALESICLDRYLTPSAIYARGLALSMTLSQTPRFLLEAVAFGGALSMLLYLLVSRGSIAGAIPLVSLYVFAGYRLLPALQEIFYSATRLRFSLASLNELYRDLADAPCTLPEALRPVPLAFRRVLRLEHVTYVYPQSERRVLDDVSLEIPRGARVAFIGPTGSGKSTTVDVILGLLRPSAGRVLVDDICLSDDEALRRWQCCIGYVPQHIFLADDTIAANIAFGQAPDKVDYAAVERAARMAQLHEFITNDLDGGYQAAVGERGIRLSGGQRQRLGLARALYGNPSVLVLDEATSALDNETEAQVMNALAAIGPEVTIIAIAHRLSTIREFDLVFRMDGGTVALAERGEPLRITLVSESFREASDS
jgi:ATP-binding cassette, subfamily B, bacterial PglK